MTDGWTRVRRMTHREISWRARAATRIAIDRAALWLRPSTWRRQDIRAVLSRDVIDAPLDVMIAAGRWAGVHDRLAHRFHERGSRFVLDPRSALALRDAVLQRDPSAAVSATQQADRILVGRYDLLGYRGLTFTDDDGRVDWHFDPVHHARAPLRFWADVPYLDPAIGDHKIIWELNRHQHWLRLGRALWLTGDARYGQRIIDELTDWQAANPPIVGVNWASMLELGLRSMSWIWGMHFLLGTSGTAGSNSGALTSEPWLVDMLVGLDRQLTHIEQNLSIYFSPNTHLTGEALALYVAGVALPELRRSRRWRDTGRRILLDEIDRQILADGGHAERSTHYHRYTLDFYLMALLTARLDGDRNAERRFAEACARLGEFASVMADGGRLPLIGDDDGGMVWPFTGRECADIRDSLAVAAIALDRPDLAPWGMQEEALWILGPGVADDVASGFSRTTRSRLFADTGYAVLRDDRGNHAVFDVGQHGYMNGGHAHADALSMTLSLNGVPLLVDPGTATYTVDAGLRDRFRSTVSHNTLTIDGRSQATPHGPFHWQTRVNASIREFRNLPAIDWAEGEHDAYSPVRHRRSVIRTVDSGWLIVDEVLGGGEHLAAAHWHFDPRWTVSTGAAGGLRALHGDHDEAWMLFDGGEVSLAHGGEASGLGWYAPAYGVVVPAWTARVVRTGHAPFVMVTWIGTVPTTSRQPPSIQRLLPVNDCEEVIAARITNGEDGSLFLMRARGALPHSGICEAHGYQTDGRLLHCVERYGSVTRVNLIDTTHAATPGRGGITIVASEPTADLHISLEDGVLDLQASRPPAHLRIQGGALDGVGSIRLNHRDVSLTAVKQGDTAFVYGADWVTPVQNLLPSIA
jgi:hypothetical protein